jgi:hypothetical protein
MSEVAKTSLSVIEQKPQSEYFDSYFNELSAKTIVVEREYIDRDYLEDYASYYVRCFQTYQRNCTRLHFFSLEFTEEEFSGLLKWNCQGLTVEKLQRSYLGFVVLKPLPQTVVGRTCLKSYEEIGGRSYPILRHYSANLFGISLSVKTLAFQEQDSVAAACATSALWSAFHGTGKLFQHAIPSPYAITKSASDHISSASRNFPNKGLTLEQMAAAIRSVGLEPYVVGAQPFFNLKSTLYGYLKGCVPVLMGLRLFEVSDSQPPRFMGMHAIAITGFRVGNQPNKEHIPFGFKSTACQITKIYAHDDGVGPFARMEFESEDLTIEYEDQQFTCLLSTSWKTESGLPGKVLAVPEVLLVPLYHKIRIPLDRVQNVILQIDVILEGWRQENLLPINARLQWDVFLSTVNDFKESAFHASTLSGDDRLSVLSCPLPHFIWRATARLNEKPMFDLLFDATDIEQGACFAHAIVYDDELDNAIHAMVIQPEVEEKLCRLAAWTILKDFNCQ